MLSFKDIKKNSEAELLKLLAEKREALRSARFGSAGSKSKNLKEGGNVKKEIAKILTILGK